MKRNLTYSCCFFPLFHKDLFSPGLRCATRLLETSCVEKITACVIETMLVTLPLVQMDKARREVKRTNQIQTKINIMKGPQTSVIHLIPGSTCHSISSRMRFFKISFGWNIFQQQLIAEKGKYMLEISYCNKDKITAKYRKGVILKTLKLRNDF